MDNGQWTNDKRKPFKKARTSLLVALASTNQDGWWTDTNDTSGSNVNVQQYEWFDFVNAMQIRFLPFGQLVGTVSVLLDPWLTVNPTWKKERQSIIHCLLTVPTWCCSWPRRNTHNGYQLPATSYQSHLTVHSSQFTTTCNASRPHLPVVHLKTQDGM